MFRPVPLNGKANWFLIASGWENYSPILKTLKSQLKIYIWKIDFSYINVFVICLLFKYCRPNTFSIYLTILIHKGNLIHLTVRLLRNNTLWVRFNIGCVPFWKAILNMEGWKYNSKYEWKIVCHNYNCLSVLIKSLFLSLTVLSRNGH